MPSHISRCGPRCADWDPGSGAVTDTILGHEAVIRLAVFLGVLGAMALWEVAAPRRRRDIPRLLRWSNNLALVVLDTLAVRLLFPVLAVGLALVTAERGWGLLHLWPVPGWFAFVASVLLLDLAIYLQHVAFHAVPALWRLHRMHHADLETDVTTGLRFHPVEILLSMAIKLAVVAATRPPGPGSADVRGAAERDRDVQPRQHPADGRLGSAPAAGPGHARHAPGAPFDGGMRRPTATTASTCLGGTGCSEPIGRSPRRPRSYDGRPRTVPNAPRPLARPHAAAAAPGRRCQATGTSGGQAVAAVIARSAPRQRLRLMPVIGQPLLEKLDLLLLCGDDLLGQPPSSGSLPSASSAFAMSIAP